MSIILVKWTAIASIPWPWRMVALALSPVMGRWAAGFAMAVFPYARDKGIGSSFHVRALALHTIVGAASTLAISLIGAWLGVGLLVIGTLVAFAVGHWMTSMFGGLTGDSYGAIIEIVEVVVLVTSSAAAFSLSRVALGPIGW